MSTSDRTEGFAAGTAMARFWAGRETVAGGDPTYRVRRITYAEARRFAREGEYGGGADDYCRALYLAYARGLPRNLRGEAAPV